MSRRLLTAAATAAIRPAASRPLHTTAAFEFPYKDSQDRESLRPRSTENTKSASDADVAANADAAFNPNKPSPEEAYDTAAKGTDPTNPLEASGANQAINKPQGDERTPNEAGSGKKIEGGGRSGGGSPPKNMKIGRN